MECTKCQSNNYIEYGSCSNKKHIKRYKCKDCGCTFIDRNKANEENRKRRRTALILYLEGLSYREIASFLGVSHTSIRNWLINYIDSLHQIRNTKPVRLGEIGHIKTELKGKKKTFREGFVFLERDTDTHISKLSPIIKTKKSNLPLDDEYYY